MAICRVGQERDLAAGDVDTREWRAEHAALGEVSNAATWYTEMTR
jgi:hypothetical protein